MTTVCAPVDWVEFVSELRLPALSDSRLQNLLDRKDDGLLNEGERAELESLVEVSETPSPVRAGALPILGRTPR